MSIQQDKGNMPGRDLPWGWIILSLALVVIAYNTTRAWERVKFRPPDRTITVTGSAKKRITSDLIEWTARISTENEDRTAAYKSAHGYAETALAYLRAQGVKDDEISLSAASVQELYDTEYTGTGEERVERTVFRGYAITQSITVRSTDVARVERMSREVTSLLERDGRVQVIVPIYRSSQMGVMTVRSEAELAALRAQAN